MSGAVPVRPFPALTVGTPRLHVRRVEPADTKLVTEIFADRQTRRWLPVPPEHGDVDARAWCTELAAERRDSGAGDHYEIVRREDDRLIGCVWTKRTDRVARVTEIGCAVAAEVRGYGLAAEAVVVVAIALLGEHGFQRVELRVAPGNTASRRVAEKAGFTYEGLLRNAGHVLSGRTDLEVWSFVTADLR
ncbi:GNAT family N-acetyltransferase [Rhizomonospora bruguierae]|uniref:GNAT family N-acetyltransferase n=1 Tax=Rhizomonospora bruguierae TaxID=1581705 RepID=UPI001BD135B7|nr:GNAT family protein [Micromonospora sp. NBRC 107566]